MVSHPFEGVADHPLGVRDWLATPRGWLGWALTPNGVVNQTLTPRVWSDQPFQTIISDT